MSSAAPPRHDDDRPGGVVPGSANGTIEGVCHCGGVRFVLGARPDWLVDCDCSMCSRLGALWGHVPIASVEIRASRPTRTYVHGDRCIAFHACGVCACTTHWEELDPERFDRMGVNFRMCPRSVIEEFRIRRRDGADAGRFLD